MGADFSRIRSDPLLDFAGVELKQGGVVLDADVNELGAIIDRRLRALASDVLGRSRVSSTTPSAFRITAGGGMLQIGRGRLYVDGLLAENHGAASDDPDDHAFDPLLAEPTLTDPTPYDAQLYLPNAPALPTTGRHLVYLDVWNRQVTHLERPELVEVAVGVESSSRVQTVWQVRVHAPDLRTATCATPDGEIAGWSALTAPSTGRLTTGTFEVPPADDPCELPPSGGYRGLENQTYRIEIHDPGQPGAGATFKWSRENASVGSRVASIVSGSELELQSLGRDDVLRLNTDDWVEIVDDVRELSQRSGEMRRITVNESARRITFAPALPAEMLPAAFPDGEFPSQRNLRVIRWDQNHQVLAVAADGTTSVVQELEDGSSGVIDVPAAGTTLLLELGVTVQFSVAPPVAPGAPAFRAGDHWVVAARTADASIEELDAAPPRGIHHHHERLGIWNVAAGEVSDCRHHWPPPGGGEDCSCTVCVSPESHADGSLTIAAAIDRIRDSGGTVCLTAGQYALRAPVQLNGVRAVTVRGQGAATVLVAPEGAFRIAASVSVTIEDLAVLSLARRSAIVVRSAFGLSLQRLLIAVLGGADFQGAAIALSGLATGLVIRDNVLFGPIGIRAGEASAGNDDPALGFLATALMRIDNNLLWCERQPLFLAGSVLHLFGNRIAGNEIVGGRQGGITVLGLAGAGTSMRICDNSLNVSGAGITAGVDGLWIEGNKLAALTGAGDRVPGSSGITLSTGLDPNGSDQCQLLANQVSGFDGAGIRIAAPVKQLIVKLNIVSGCGNGIVAEDEARSGDLSIENNHVFDIGARGAAASAEVLGIGVVRAESASVVGNHLQRIGVLAASAALRAGIAATAVQRLHIGANDIADIAPRGSFEAGLGAGVLVRPPYGNVAIADNQIARDSQGGAQPGGRFVALRVDDSTGQAPNSRVGAYTALRVNPTTTLVLGARRAFVVAAAVGDVTAAPATANVSVRGNRLSASGRLPAVQIDAAGDCQFSENRCELRSGSDAAVRLNGTTTIVSGNRVLGGEVSIDIRSDPKRATVLGNITDRAINLGTGLPAPWDALNIRV